MSSTLLVIDDDRSVLHLVTKALQSPTLQVLTALTPDDGLQKIREAAPDVVLLDIMFPKVSGLDLFKQIQTLDRRLPVVFITAGAGSDTAIQAMQLGAYDYVAKPLDLVRLHEVVAKAFETRRLMNVPVAVPIDDDVTFTGDVCIGRSPQMLEVFKAVGRVAQQDVPVLIRGESGTGKELIARAIYHHSHRRERPFLAVNCAALPDTLLESELFGHEKGAFTGADRRRIGKFEQCSGGTLFLDEVGDMAPLCQSKMLRLLQDQQFERVGGNETVTTDVRVITATNRNLDEMVDKGTFRGDLFYRLNGVTIYLPPLRERSDEIPILLKYFLSRARRNLKKTELEGISPEALDVMTGYSWPGNVRELQSVVQQAVLNSTGSVITPECLPPEVLNPRRPGAAPTSGSDKHRDGLPPGDLEAFVDRRIAAGTHDLYAETLEMMERYLFTRVLQDTKGVQTKAADLLGITRGKIRDRIAAFNITLDKNVSIEEGVAEEAPRPA